MPAAIQVSGEIAVTCYRVTHKFTDKDGQGKTYIKCITHPWLKGGKNWHIIGAMSMPEGATAQWQPRPNCGEPFCRDAHYSL
jgi:hypothetical protein